MPFEKKMFKDHISIIQLNPSVRNLMFDDTAVRISMNCLRIHKHKNTCSSTGGVGSHFF